MSTKIWPVCWKSENVSKTISLKARLDPTQTHYFLACHTPIKNIRDALTLESIDEEELYRRLMGSGQRDLQAVVYGDPGTGKSHLIHWLKLRCDDDAGDSRSDEPVTVLIERRSGSLKDALEQLVSQLGEHFSKYLDPVQQAIDKLSDSSARKQLADKIGLEVGDRWEDRGREPLHKLLKDLGEACKVGGFGGWLCRDGGVIDRRIELLTKPSEVHDRLQAPEFTVEDVLPPPRFQSLRDNTGRVVGLIEELIDDPKLAEDAARVLNVAMRDAVVELIGLSGSNLRGLFDQIRRDLQKAGKRLLIFVEDVSAMAELDMEVVNALEPQDDTNLCPMTAVLGMTASGYHRLRDNQKQRFGIQVRIEADSSTESSDDSERIATFTARYLNATRLDETDVRRIADHRRETHGDVNVSRCTSCEARQECHARFGMVEFNGVQIGLFPLNLDAPRRLLAELRVDEANGVTVSPRGLLMHLVRPILSDPNTIAEGRFPRRNVLPVRTRDPIWWTGFAQSYVGTWNDDDRDRLRFLGQFWLEVENAEQAAAAVEPLLAELRFPKLTKAADSGSLKERSERTREVPKPKPRESEKVPDANRVRLQSLLDSLRAWVEGELLNDDKDCREVLAGFIRSSIPWETDRRPTRSQWDLIAAGYAFIKIQGQRSSPANQLFYLDCFARTEETRSLLEALLRFKYEGGQSWDFEHGAIHKRIVSRWLRAHVEDVFKSLQPEDGVLPSVALECAVRFLCAVATIRQRRKLPKDYANLLEAIFDPAWDEAHVPFALTPKWQSLLEDMARRQREVREFVADELAVTQGRTGGCIFVDPRAILDIAHEFCESPSVAVPPADFFRSFWKSRFHSIALDSYRHLDAVLSEERNAISDLVSMIIGILHQVDIDTTEVSSAFVRLRDSLKQLRDAADRHKCPFPHASFDQFYRTGYLTKSAEDWGRATRDGAVASSGSDIQDILAFDASTLRAAADAAKVCGEYVDRFEARLSQLEAEDSGEGADPLAVQSDLLQLLTELADARPKGSEVTDGTD